MRPGHDLRLMPGILILWLTLSCGAAEVFPRCSQLGYRPDDPKSGIAFGSEALPGSFQILRAPDQKVVFSGKGLFVPEPWGCFTQHLVMDFSSFRKPGRYTLRIGGTQSLPFEIRENIYSSLPDQLLEFMRQQRCGHNPWLKADCHLQDGRTAFGPLTNGTSIDATGGWHDAADLLKYMITSGNATAQLLLAWQLGQGHVPFQDGCNGLGEPGPNGVPDILDEARWGLLWMLRMHPAPDQLYHQVADDRDHIGQRLPQNEVADYGWGKGGARVVYFADGKPQGLRQYQSESTGIANLAGRYAAAMGLAFQIWKDDPHQAIFARECLKAGREVYAMGRAREGVQQGNSYRAPYRYEESTWADDMEWGAAELFRATGEDAYLQDALRYARVAGSESWMGQEQTRHYQFYPFMNLGHFRLYDLAEPKTRRQLAGYYREGIERCRMAGKSNPYSMGAPFIWCSNNLLTALATQCLLLERMTGDHPGRLFAAQQRDWLLGRNPWGFSMFTGIGSIFPKDPHLMTMQITRRPVPGGLVDGPVYLRIFKSLKGVAITEPDPLAQFQGPAVYHDDMQDYSTNEPTMDGTASAILLWALCAR